MTHRHLAALLAVFAAWPAAAEQRQFDVAAQSATQSVPQFAQQAGVQIVAPGSELRGIRTGRLHGAFEVSDGLRQLLQGTGLQFKQAADGAIVIMSAQAGSAPPAQSSPSDLETVTVTGTHIRGVTPDSSPVTIYNRKEIARLGVSNVEQLLRKLPQNLSNLDGSTFYTVSNDQILGSNVTHGSTVNLRGLGPGATLILVNGQRLAPSGTDGAFFDTSSIPLSALKRVEVLSDGGSAIYGADAIAGVVNFVLRDDYDGAETSASYGGTSVGDGQQLTASHVLGHSWQSGNAMMSAEYQSAEPYSAAHRSFLADPPGTYQFTPQQREGSGTFTLQQKLGSSMRLSADVLLSDRKYRQTTTYADYLVDDAGSARGAAEVIRLRQDIGHSWRADATVANSRSSEHSAAVLSFQAGGLFTTLNDSVNQLKSLDVTLDWPMFNAPGGIARLSAGGSVRKEEFSHIYDVAEAAIHQQSDLARSVNGLYVEAFVPLIGDANARAGVTRLELSIAARRDHYSDVGASTNPKIGLLWSPMAGLAVRSTYSTAFRVPPLGLLVNDPSYEVTALPDPAAASGATTTLWVSAQGNPTLRPEKSRSFTLGFDLSAAWIPDLTAAITYFNISYQDRIQAPCPDLQLLFTTCAAVAAPFLNRPPDLALVSQIFSQFPIVDDIGGTTPGDVQAYFDDRSQNIATTRTSGIDLSVSYHLSFSRQSLDLFSSGSDLLNQSLQSGSGAPAVDTLNTIYSAVAVRARVGATWTLGNIAATAALNYTDRYKDTRMSPSIPISSWTTADLHVDYQLTSATFLPLKGLSVSVDVDNFFDAHPPHVTPNPFSYDPGIDGANATARGRYLRLELRKKW